MKQINTIIVCLLFCVTVHAQNISGSHQVRVNDEVKKQQVEYAVVDSTGQGMVWDLSEVELPKWTLTASYTEEDSHKGVVIGTERNTRYYYDSKPEAVVLRGFENNLLKVEYDLPEVQLRMPLVYGSRHEGQFHGTSAYCEKVFSRTFGTYHVVVDGTGSMVLPSGDTLRHVSRVHSTKLTSARFFPEVQRERMLKTFVDSIKFPVDSIRLGVVKDTLVIETNTYRWYAAGYRYPILEVISTGYKGGKPWKMEAYYCAPEEQLPLDDPENEEARKLLAGSGNNGSSGSGSDNDNSSRDGNSQNGLGNILQDLSVTVSGSAVTVNYTLLQDATVTAMVCDISGVVHSQQSRAGQPGEACQMTISCDGLRRGQYVLYLSANGQVASQAISL